MATQVIMPRQGQSVESCVITKWFKSPGDKVNLGDVLFSYETDKAAFEEAAPVYGTLLAVFFEEGDDVPVLKSVCVIGAPGEDVSAFAPGDAAATENSEVPASPPSAAQTPSENKGVVSPFNGKISPRARALSERLGIIPSALSATGPDGRVIARDVQAAADRGQILSSAARKQYSGEAATGTGIGGRVTLEDLKSGEIPKAEQTDMGFTIEPLSRMRKMIAKSMTQSLSTMAQLTHNLSFDATEILELRKRFKENGAKLGMDGVTINDMILYAVSRTLVIPSHRALNAHLNGDEMKLFADVHLGMAVDTERGLMVPTLFNANRLSLMDISAQAKKLAKECQAGTVNPDNLSGASFTLSNLGALGIESFTPVINPPQTGILGVNTIITRVREEKGQLVAYPSMALSLTYDHRALDGAPASRFLMDLKTNLENFTMLMAK